jgi:hypothetical protein
MLQSQGREEQPSKSQQGGADGAGVFPAHAVNLIGKVAPYRAGCNLFCNPLLCLAVAASGNERHAATFRAPMPTTDLAPGARLLLATIPPRSLAETILDAR